jgi:hypothetical protein
MLWAPQYLGEGRLAFVEPAPELPVLTGLFGEMNLDILRGNWGRRRRVGRSEGGTYAFSTEPYGIAVNDA